MTRVSAALIALAGIAIVAAVVAGGVLAAGPAVDRVASSWADAVGTDDGIRSQQVDADYLRALAAEADPLRDGLAELLPPGDTDDVLAADHEDDVLAADHEDVDSGLATVTGLADHLTGLGDSFQARRFDFHSLETYPAAVVPAAAAPWAGVAIGVLLLGSGIALWFGRRTGARLAFVVGLVATLATTATALVPKSAEIERFAHEVTSRLTPDLLDATDDAPSALRAFASGIDETLIPAIAEVLDAPNDTARDWLSESYPATGAAAASLPDIADRVEKLGDALNERAADVGVLDDARLATAAWVVIVACAAALILAGVQLLRRPRPVTYVPDPAPGGIDVR